MLTGAEQSAKHGKMESFLQGTEQTILQTQNDTTLGSVQAGSASCSTPKKRILEGAAGKLKISDCSMCPKHKADYKREKSEAGKWTMKLTNVICTNGNFNILHEFINKLISVKCKLPVDTGMNIPDNSR